MTPHPPSTPAARDPTLYAALRAAAAAGPVADPGGPDPNRDLDAHILAALVASCPAPVADRLPASLGLAPAEGAALLDIWFPGVLDPLSALPPGTDPTRPPADAAIEEAALRALLLDGRSPQGDSRLGGWLACALARRSLGPHHLWEDLGLDSRADLGRLMARHFAPLAAANPGMRWKKYFYRALCAQEGLVLCKAPVCTDCPDYAACFDGSPSPGDR